MGMSVIDSFNSQLCTSMAYSLITVKALPSDFQYISETKAKCIAFTVKSE